MINVKSFKIIVVAINIVIITGCNLNLCSYYNCISIFLLSDILISFFYCIVDIPKSCLKS